MPKQQSNQNSTIDVEEVERFSALFNEWWDGNGKLKTLHDINPIRIKYIKEVVIKHFKIKDSIQVFGNLKIIDIGCGGGLLSVPMNKLGAKVTGIDPSKESIKIAKHYAKENKLAIDFQCTDTKDAAKKHKGTFDVVLNMEVVEHVADVEKFLEESSHLAKQNGLMFVSTINKTLKSLVQAKISAEYILRWLPINTHQWNKFLKPSQLMRILDQNHMQLIDIVGMSYNLLKKDWYISNKLDVNYIACFKKTS